MKKIVTLCCTLLLCTLTFAEQQKPLTVVLDWFVNPQHAPLIVAQEQGFFKARGIRVNIIAPSDPSDPPKLVASQHADIGIDYQPELYLQIAQGLPIIRIGTLVNVPLRVIATLKSSGIDSLTKMSGKKIGDSLSGVGDVFLNMMLKANHVELKNVEVINVHYDLVQALLSKKIDAVNGVQRNFEVPELQLAGQQVNAFYPQDNGVPLYDELIFIAHKNQLHDPRLLAFMQAIHDAMHYIKAHPHESWQLLIKNHPEINNQLNKISWQITQPLFATNPLAFNKQRYQTFAQWLKQQHLIKTVLPISDYAVDLNAMKYVV